MKNIYLLEIHFKKSFVDKINLQEIEKIILSNCNIIEKKQILYSNEKFSIDKVSSYLNIYIDDKPLKLEQELKKIEYIKSFKIQKEDKIEDNIEIEVNLKEINGLINNIDKLYYIRKKIKSSLKDVKSNELENTLEELSTLKYNLKRNVFRLKMVNIKKEISKIELSILEYINFLNLKTSFKINYDNIFVDKILFKKIKSKLLDLIYEILSSNKTSSMTLNIRQEIYNFVIDIIIDMPKEDIDRIYSNAVKLNILSEDIKYYDNEILKCIFDKRYINSIMDETVKEKNLIYTRYYNLMESLNSNIDVQKYDDKFKIETKIPLETIYINGFVFEENLKSYVINKEEIIDIFDFDIENIIELNGYKYYKYKDKKIIYTNLPIEKENCERLGLLLKINTLYTIVDVSKKYYEEEIYMEKKKYLSFSWGCVI